MAAMPLGFCSTFSTAATPSSSSAMPKSSSSSLVFLQPKRRTVLTYATASKPATETETKKRAPRGFSKPRPVSPEMKDFLGGTSEIPRTEVLKVIWAYIKEKDLQDPANKRVIICDDKLKKIFGERDHVGFLEIAGLISPHFLKEGTSN
ncbi:hypothetical protein OSB04_006283 [Centaurea solstitialis]|uniref:DM2 domain-containing protein n=1 Tax=Centaurea solstitialis TaxID=347529 RepID=A0AA38TQ73_9ASTR|nr:hypothetical protein OSB04_006283 [Centaurea solstitialis]